MIRAGERVDRSSKVDERLSDYIRGRLVLAWSLHRSRVSCTSSVSWADRADTRHPKREAEVSFDLGRDLRKETLAGTEARGSRWSRRYMYDGERNTLSCSSIAVQGRRSNSSNCGPI